VRRVAEAVLPMQDGPTFRAIVYDNSIDQHQHMALVLGDVRGIDDVLVRLHSECLTGDVFGSERCDCGDQLRQALEMISAEGRGVLVYLPSGRARHRPREQDPRVRAPGPGP
jgi:3,4-dihydroxy 2-butanone 4-phosphate synthase/GTP cyclohydrolase II